MMKRLALVISILTLGVFALPHVVLATDAQLACSPTTSTVAVGSTITTDIILNSRSFEVTGADAILTYTTGVLETDAASVVPVLTDTSWTAPTNKVVDTTLGKIELDYGQAQSVFTTSGTIARVTFTAKQEGTANVKFVFFQEYDDTTSGVAKVWGEKTEGVKSNILTDVVDCAYTVTGAAAPTTPPATPSALPRTGNFETTMILVGSGALLAFLGFILPRIIF